MKKTIKISQQMWKTIGEQAGWLKGKAFLKQPRLPDQFADKISEMPESSMGAVTLSVKLNDGRVVNKVTVSGNDLSVLWVGERKISDLFDMQNMGFNPENVIDVF